MCWRAARAPGAGCRAELGSRTALVDHHKQHAEALLDELSSLVGAGTEGYSAGWACRLRALLRSPLVREFLRAGEGTLEQYDTMLRQLNCSSDPICQLCAACNCPSSHC